MKKTENSLFSPRYSLAARRAFAPFRAFFFYSRRSLAFRKKICYNAVVGRKTAKGEKREMLEVSHLTKIYKTKNGPDVRALDDVSVRFPETGMVFLLGKSGSGKSTLLNVCGGLDSPTDGEIVVKGRSSREFTQSDFDSYRNTFVGFVFQEYNILDEFTVEDNIALALELQGKPKDKRAIAEILAQVDLAGYASRRPNTLSGGQKQRIAIARALVKSPEIIMADEPTGALDSATGKQVFDTLKKLSANKLVLVVSHDRDFAERYGDRVIELQDGRIVSDVTKTQERQAKISDNVSAVGDTLCVKGGAELTESDFSRIREYLAGASGDVVIAGGKQEVKAFREAARINADGEKESFRETDETALPKKTYAAEDSRFIRSRLPARHAFRIGASGLKTKPLRLFFTILLSTVSFVLFGLSSTMTLYNESATLKKSLMNSSYDVLPVGKEYVTHYTSYDKDGEVVWKYDSASETSFTQAETEKFTKEFGAETFAATSFSASVSNVSKPDDSYYSASLSFFAYLPASNPMRERVTGSYPAEGGKEILLNSFTAESLQNLGLNDPETDHVYSLSTPSELVGKKIVVNGETYTVSGILPVSVPDKYAPLKEDRDHVRDYSLYSEWRDERSAGLCAVAFIDRATETELLEARKRQLRFARFDEEFSDFTLDAAYGSESLNPLYYAPFSAKYKYPVAFFDEQRTTLGEGEILLGYNSAYDLMEAARDAVFGERTAICEREDAELLARMQAFRDVIDRSEDEEEIANAQAGYAELDTQRSRLWEELDSFTETYDRVCAELYLLWAYPGSGGEYLSEIGNFFTTYGLSLPIGLRLSVNYYDEIAGETESSAERTLRLVGLVDSPYRNGCYLSDGDFAAFNAVEKQFTGNEREERSTKYVAEEDALWSTVFIPYNRSSSLTDKILEAVGEDFGNDGFYTLNTPVAREVCSVTAIVEIFSDVFLYAGLILAVFAALLLCNFISVSITYKKREIGILRAVGARSLDVFKIFFAESLVITVVCVLLSCVGGAIVCNLLNAKIGASLNGVSVFVFGPLSMLILIGVALLTAVVSTFLPVQSAAGKKPVESIRAF